MSDDSSRALRLRLLATTLAMPLAPLVVLIAFLAFDPINDDATDAHQVQQATSHLGTVLPFAALYLLFGLLSFGLVTRLAGAIRERGSGWANAGALLGTLGSAAVVLGAARRAVLWVLIKSDAPHAVTVMTKLDKSVYAVIVVLILGIPLGYLALGIAAYRAHLASRPVVAALVLLVVSFMVGANAPAAAFGLLAFGAIGQRLVRNSTGFPAATAHVEVSPIATA